MTCGLCVHWEIDDTAENERRAWGRDSSDGRCFRYPTPVKTNGSHTCGELQASRSAIRRLLRNQQNLRNAWHAHQAEKERRIQLEKKLKEVRRKLRDERRAAS